ncbi:hypothetical protein P692DRAFT_2044787 [Suillus brevipes Sb2]|nr:hypothetical protein P692DRAFT_2044787 [Suillus brevipes Sb2]
MRHFCLDGQEDTVLEYSPTCFPQSGDANLKIWLVRGVSCHCAWPIPWNLPKYRFTSDAHSNQRFFFIG